jgi:glycosyltransferase involved in cell wall biosynthesis
MALGLPVISTDCPIGGSRLCIENEKNGLLVPVKDAKSMTQAMNRLASDSEFAVKLGKEAGKVRERFSAETIVEKWCEQVLVKR